MKLILFFIFFIVGIMSHSYAQGIGISPSKFNLELPMGKVIEEKLVLYNPSSEEISFIVECESICNSIETVTKGTIPSLSYRQIPLRFLLTDDVALDTSLYIKTASSGMIELGTKIPIHITPKHSELKISDNPPTIKNNLIADFLGISSGTLLTMCILIGGAVIYLIIALFI